ncbi:hypothetical protein [Hankyongella ginsenosidimutans]|nr:hypothetical protein [Hankyongella ginsenosidimutans]
MGVGMPDRIVALSAAVPLRLGKINDRAFSLAARFKIVVLLGLAPVALLTQLFVSQSLKDIHFAEQERIGVTYLEAAWPAHSLASLGEPAGSESAPAATIAAAARAIDTTAAKLDEALESKAQSQAVAAAFSGWQGDVAQRKAAGAAVDALITRIGDKSNLILDPDLDSFYVMDVALLKLPQLMRSASRVNRAAGFWVQRHPRSSAWNSIQHLARWRLITQRSMARSLLPMTAIPTAA